MEYVSEIKSITKQISWYNKNIKDLRLKRLEAQNHLYDYMIDHSVVQIENIKIENVTPKITLKRKTAKQKREDGIRKLRGIGVPEPEKIYAEIIESKILGMSQS